MAGKGNNADIHSIDLTEKLCNMLTIYSFQNYTIYKEFKIFAGIFQV